MSDHKRAKVMEIAVSLIDKPSIKYRNPTEGMSPEKGFDCSGFVTYVLKEAGLFVPPYIGMDKKVRNTRHANEYWDHYGVTVHEDQAVMGDLIFWSRDGTFPTHVGILTYHNTYIHAPGKDGAFVEEAPLLSNEIKPYEGYKRQLYVWNPIGAKALSTVVDNPTLRHHQRPMY
jgi:cell wall-associated NlpC family hydrolase